jgi:hypothetical protein
MGKELRRQVPRRLLGEWSAQPDRPDPVQLIIESHEGRLDWLIPVRVGRMAAAPYGFLRGAAIVMAEDVARLPSTGITPVICGGASGLASSRSITVGERTGFTTCSRILRRFAWFCG